MKIYLFDQNNTKHEKNAKTYNIGIHPPNSNVKYIIVNTAAYTY